MLFVDGANKEFSGYLGDDMKVISKRFVVRCIFILL